MITRMSLRGYRVLEAPMVNDGFDVTRMTPRNDNQ